MNYPIHKQMNKQKDNRKQTNSSQTVPTAINDGDDQRVTGKFTLALRLFDDATLDKTKISA